MENQNLFVSKDAQQIEDEKGNIVALRKEVNGKVFYKEVEMESRGEGKVCVEFKPQRVCLVWGEKEGDRACLEWGGIDVCIKWEFQS